MKVDRHKTAIRRGQLSRPVVIALRDKVLDSGHTYFDFGCGHGQDVEYLQEMGFQARGWDPVFAPEAPKSPSDIVNLGYVVNVIEDPAERADTLRDAFALAKKALVVSAMVGFRDRGDSDEHSDGVLTSRGTFQKYFEQQELADYISATLRRDAYAAGLGVFYVFADAAAEGRFCREIAKDQDTSSSLSALTSISIPASSLVAIADQVSHSKRLPAPSEMPDHGVALGILASSDDWLERLSGHLTSEQVVEIRRLRRQDLIMQLAASNYSVSGKLRLADLGIVERADVRSLFGSMGRAYLETDRVLRDVMNSEQIADVCRTWGGGKMTPSSLYVHISLLSELPFELRLLVACGRAIAAEALNPDTNILKINHGQLGMTFATYLEFDQDPHPQLAEALRVDFETSTWASRDYRNSKSPPILHRKELFVGPDYPLRDAFAGLSAEEESLGLLGRRDIGAKLPWERLLARMGVKLERHQVTRIEPYELPEPADEPAASDEDELDIPLPGARQRRSKVERKPKATRWTEQVLDTLAEAVIRHGRPPMPQETSLSATLVRRFAETRSWQTLLGPRFNPEEYEESRRERWKYWIVRLGSERFQLSGKTKLKQLDDSARADIRAFFGNYSQALAESEQWLIRIGNQEEIRSAIASWPWGLHHEEKGLYIHSSLEPRLPVLLRLLVACARFMAWDCLPARVDVTRFAAQGESVKLYQYDGFEEPGAAKCVSSVIVDFRRRRVIPRTYERRLKTLGERHELLPSEHPLYAVLRDWSLSRAPDDQSAELPLSSSRP